MWSIPVLYLSSRAMARPIFASLSAVQQDTGKHEPDDRDTVDHAFSANDGVVPIFSQWHPFDCRYEVVASAVMAHGASPLLCPTARQNAGIRRTPSTIAGYTGTKAHRRYRCDTRMQRKVSGMCTTSMLLTTSLLCHSGWGRLGRRRSGGTLEAGCMRWMPSGLWHIRSNACSAEGSMCNGSQDAEARTILEDGLAVSCTRSVTECGNPEHLLDNRT